MKFCVAGTYASAADPHSPADHLYTEATKTHSYKDMRIDCLIFSLEVCFLQNIQQ